MKVVTVQHEVVVLVKVIFCPDSACLQEQSRVRICMDVTFPYLCPAAG